MKENQLKNAVVLAKVPLCLTLNVSIVMMMMMPQFTPCLNA
jgi:hypothetical protein